MSFHGTSFCTWTFQEFFQFPSYFSFISHQHQKNNTNITFITKPYGWTNPHQNGCSCTQNNRKMTWTHVCVSRKLYTVISWNSNTNVCSIVSNKRLSNVYKELLPVHLFEEQTSNIGHILPTNLPYKVKQSSLRNVVNQLFKPLFVSHGTGICTYIFVS